MTRISDTKAKLRRFRDIAFCILLQAIFQVQAGNLPMHYTSRSALRSLIESKCFRLYDAPGTDDRSEGRFAFERMRMAEPDRLMAQLYGGTPAPQMFVGSFVINSDNRVGDDLMWRTHGDRRTGCALVFDRFSTASLEDIIEGMAASQVRVAAGQTAERPVSMDELLLFRVYYGTSQMQEQFEELGRLLRTLDFAQFDEHSRAMAGVLLNFLRFLCKKKIYSREEELRLMVLRPALPGTVLSGEGVARGDFARIYVECPHIFRPTIVILGPAFRQPEKGRIWAEAWPWTRGDLQAGLQPIEVVCADRGILLP